MLDWPTAAVIISVLIPATVAIMKLVPQRGSRNDDSGSNRNNAAVLRAETALTAEVATLKAQNVSLMREIDQLRGDMHSLWNEIKTLREALSKANEIISRVAAGK
jgi:predicted  nucleic acid-binding Zn-ribbon protein